MFTSYFKSAKYGMWAWGGLALLVISAWVQVQLTVSLNYWYGEFYNILQTPQEHTMSDFWQQMLRFCQLAFPYVLIATANAWFSRIYCFKWRTALTFYYHDRWTTATISIEGASQRIQEDTYRFARITENLGLKIIKAILTLIAFIPLLWSLNSLVIVPLVQDLPGGLVGAALLVSIGGVVISWFVGIKLPGLEYTNQRCEAALRKHLVYAEDDLDKRADPTSTADLFEHVRHNYRRLFNHYGYFDIWSNTFEQLMTIIPYIIMVPSLFAGVIMLGTLVQVSNAFTKVRESFQIFISEWTTITELRSIHKRLSEFDQSLDV